MGFIKYATLILSLSPWFIQGQSIPYPQDSTALIYVIQGHARASAAYFESASQADPEFILPKQNYAAVTELMQEEAAEEVEE